MSQAINQPKMKHVILVIAMGFFAALFGCGKKQEPASMLPKPAPTLPEITSMSEEEGLIDLVFAIAESKSNADGSSSFHAQGLHRGGKVGLRVFLRPSWKEGTLGPRMTTFQGEVLYESTGEESDRFVQVLGELYQSSVCPKMMRKGQIPFTAITLGGNPHDLSLAPVKIKLFFESEAEDQYAEIYTNIDAKKSRLEIMEKDPDYRESVMRAIGEK